MKEEKMPSQIKTGEETTQWFDNYYLDPQPNLVLSAIKNSSKSGEYDRPEIIHAVPSFLSVIFQQYPDQLSAWIQGLNDLPTANLQIIYRALWLCNSPASKKILAEILRACEQYGDMYEMLTGLFQNEPPDLKTMTIAGPAQLDMLWAGFHASGDEIYVKRIITTLPWADEKRPDKMTVGQMANWSLASMAYQHARVMKICQQEIRQCRRVIKPFLAEAIDSAEKKLAKQTN